MIRLWSGVLLLFANSAQARQAVGLILTTQNAELRPAGNSVHLHAEAGDLLFSGDTLLTAGDGKVTFAFCPTRVRYVLEAGASATLEEQKFRQGKPKQLGMESYCALPDLPVGSDPRLQAAAEYLALTPASGAGAADERLDSARSAELKEKLAEFGESIDAEPANLLLLVSKAVFLTQYGQTAAAQAVYRTIRQGPRPPAWISTELADTASRGVRLPDRTAAAAEGATYALLVGVSAYESLDKSTWLQYADADAQLMRDYLRSPRGGSVPEANIHTLTNAGARREKIQAELAAIMAGAGPNDTVIVFIAAHGLLLNGGTHDGAYILTHEASFEKPEDALPMRLIQNLIEAPGGKAKQVLVFVDVCHAGTIGLLPSASRALNQRTGETLDKLATSASVFGLMASESNQSSLESKRFGDGHGAFTWYLLQGLNGAAASSGPTVSRESLMDYVYNAVCEATAGHQTPAIRGNPQLNVAIVEDSTKIGIALPAMGEIAAPKRCPAKPLPPRGPSAPAAAPIVSEPPVSTESPRAITPEQIRFERALAALAGDVTQLPAAVAAMEALAPQVTPVRLAMARNRIRVVLETNGDQVLDKYVAGEEVNQTEADFLRCAADFDEALRLSADNPVLAAKSDFCRGRALIFQKRPEKYTEAIGLLERAVREDPLQSYALNALGIAYLELGRLDAAVFALRDAIRLSPFWAYPRHNLALALREQGKYDEALREYAAARLRAPSRSYLAYNQGLIYQQVHLDEEAARAYQDAIALSHGATAKPFLAKGLLEASRHLFDASIADYRHALTLAAIPEDRLAARHNLALALMRNPKSHNEAFDLWKDNLKDQPGDLPTRLAFGDAVAREGDTQGAIEQYRAVTQLAPGYVAARIELSRLLLKMDRFDEAVRCVRDGLVDREPNSLLYEALGDAERKAGHPAEAGAAYAAGAAHAADRNLRKRLELLARQSKP